MSEKLRAIDLHEAIQKIEEQRIGRDEIVILSPLGVMAALLHDEQLKDEMAHFTLVQIAPGKRSTFSGVLVIEDSMHDKVVVRSLISHHRIVLTAPSQADRICGMLKQCEER